MDDADKAEEREQRQREEGIARARSHPSLPPCGACYNCGELLRGDRRWCDADCRTDYERWQR